MDEEQRSLGLVKAPPQKRRASIRVESAETQDFVSAPPLNNSHGAKDGGNEEEMKELCAVSEPRRARHMCDNKCGEEDFKPFPIVATVTEGGRAARTIYLCKNVLECVAAGAGRTRSVSIEVERVGGAKRPFEESCGQHLAWSNSCAQPDRSWQMQKGKMEQTADGSSNQSQKKSEFLRKKM